MNSKFALSQGAGQKLEFAVQRNGGTAEDIEYLSTGDNFHAVTLLRTGAAKLVLAVNECAHAKFIDGEGNLHFSVTSNGMTAKEWENYHASRGCHYDQCARGTLSFMSDPPTNGVTYNVVLRSVRKFSQDERKTKFVRKYAKERGWKIPSWEIACLIIDALSNEDFDKLGLSSLVIMHEPAQKSSDTSGRLLYLAYDAGTGKRVLSSYGDRSDVMWVESRSPDSGCVFVES